MSYEYERSLRGPEREAVLLAEAERLIAQRAQAKGLPARAVVNAIFPVESSQARKPSDDDDIAAMLVERLARRDQTGAGSGGD